VERLIDSIALDHQPVGDLIDLELLDDVQRRDLALALREVDEQRADEVVVLERLDRVVRTLVEPRRARPRTTRPRSTS
jgi:hypothetical protein